MQNDDQEICLCFHVSRRKIRNFIRIERPRVASQISECGGAGTGCGWCRPVLRRMLDQAQMQGSEVSPEPFEFSDQEKYAAERRAYLQREGITPPNAPG